MSRRVGWATGRGTMTAIWPDVRNLRSTGAKRDRFVVSCTTAQCSIRSLAESLRGEEADKRFCLSLYPVALGLTPQVLPSGERVPQDEYDRTLDGIVMPSGVLRAKDDRGRWE